MMPKPSLTDLRTPQPTDDAGQQIRQLVVEHLGGRNVNGRSFIDEILVLAHRVGVVRCTPVEERGLRFELSGREPFEVDLDANHGKLRMLCARLAVLCQENGYPFMPYGGEGIIRKPVAGSFTISADESTAEWTARWTNTPGRHEFTIEAAAR
jgi:hypothetical protein